MKQNNIKKLCIKFLSLILLEILSFMITNFAYENYYFGISIFSMFLFFFPMPMILITFLKIIIEIFKKIFGITHRIKASNLKRVRKIREMYIKTIDSINYSYELKSDNEKINCEKNEEESKKHLDDKVLFLRKINDSEYIAYYDEIVKNFYKIHSTMGWAYLEIFYQTIAHENYDKFVKFNLKEEANKLIIENVNVETIDSSYYSVPLSTKLFLIKENKEDFLISDEIDTCTPFIESSYGEITSARFFSKNKKIITPINVTFEYDWDEEFDFYGAFVDFRTSQDLTKEEEKEILLEMKELLKTTNLKKIGPINVKWDVSKKIKEDRVYLSIDIEENAQIENQTDVLLHEKEKII